MIALLALELIVMASLLLRFVHPGAAAWVRDLVVAAKVNRQFLVAAEGGAPLHRGDFGAMLERMQYSQAEGSSAIAMKSRCLRVRELLAMMSARNLEGESTRKADVGGAILELADMLRHLGTRIPRGLDDATPVVGADAILRTVLEKTAGAALAEAGDLDTWFERNRVSVEQVGELLIAAVYALAGREELAEGGVQVNVSPSPWAPGTSMPPAAAGTAPGAEGASLEASLTPGTPPVARVQGPKDPRSAPLSVPPKLLDAHVHDKLAVFVGSGLSLGRDVRGGFPSWRDLPMRLLQAGGALQGRAESDVQAELERYDRYMSLDERLAELGTLKARLGRTYRTALDDVFRPRDAAPGSAHKAVVALVPRAILTSNYDQLLEMADPPPWRQPYTWLSAPQALADLQDGRRVLLKVHGSVEDPHSVVMSDAEYQRVRQDASYQAVISFLFQDYTFMFVGYGMNDPLDLDLALRGNATRFAASARTHFVLLKDARDEDRDRIAREYNVTVLPYLEHDQIPSFLSAIRKR